MGAVVSDRRMERFRGDWRPAEADAVTVLPNFWQRDSLVIGYSATEPRDFLSAMTAAARAAPDAAAFRRLYRDNKPALDDLDQGDPVMYGDLVDEIGQVWRCLKSR